MSESARILELEKEVRDQRATIEQVRAENALLRQKIDLLVRRIFGRSSEALSPDQLELLLGSDTPNESGKADASWADQPREAPDHDPRRPAARRSPRERWPEDLPVIEEVLEPAEVKADPAAWRRIGQEVSESLDYEPARFLRRRLVRPKYVARRVLDAVPVVAPLPPCLRERGVAAPGLIAAIVVAKYCDHLPLYRQEAIFASRHGVTLPRQSLARWVELAADWLRPVYDAIGQEIRAGGYVQVDEPKRSGDCLPQAARRARRSRGKHRSATWHPATARPNSATFGPPAGPATATAWAMSTSAGKPAAPPVV